MTDEKRLQQLKEESRHHLVMMGHDEDAIEFTCDECICRTTCDWAYDEWNTNGDCILDK